MGRINKAASYYSQDYIQSLQGKSLGANSELVVYV
jgi:hypothetical protein